MITELQQQQAIQHITTTFDNYKELLSNYHKRLLDIYKEKSSFVYPKKADWSTTFKVNKMHEVSNKVTPRIVSKDPKWIVSFKPDVINEM
jgi:hypothetical protein